MGRTAGGGDRAQSGPHARLRDAGEPLPCASRRLQGAKTIDPARAVAAQSLRQGAQTRAAERVAIGGARSGEGAGLVGRRSMRKIVTLMKRRAGLSVEDFQGHLRDIYGPLAAK